jgi:hypothetical protein
MTGGVIAGGGVGEGYRIVPNIDREKYQERPGLEGPFRARNGKVYYYDPKAGMAYDPDTDFYIDYDELKLMDQDPSMKMENNIKSGRSAQERFNASYKKATGTDLNDQEKFWKEKQKEIAKRKQEYIDQGIISPDEEVKEELRPKHIMGGLALVAALMGADHLTSAKQTPLGKAMAVAAQQGDQDAAKYLANLDELIDTKQSVLLTKLSNKYLRGMEESATIVTPRDVPTLNKESSIMRGLQNEAKKMKGEDPCWDGYEMIGKKKKDGKEVPNCVPKKKK